MLQPKKKKQPPISSSLKTGIDFIQNTSKAIGKSKVAKNIVPMGSFFGLFDSFINDHPYQFSDVVGVVPTQATQIASLVLDYAEKEKENLKEFATKKMQGKDISKIKPEEEELNLTTKSTIPSTPNLAFGTNQDGIMKAKMNLRKKYAAGTGVNGVKNYIPNPADALAENNKMMAEAEISAMQNPWLPIVGIAGGLASTAIGSGTLNKPGVTRPAVTTVDAGLTMAQGTAALGMQDSEQSQVEVEGGEVMETPDGQVQELEGATHEDGGIPLDNVPQGTDFFSVRLKGKDGKTMAERKIAREKKRSNLLDMISTNSTDIAVKNTAQRKMGFLDKEEQEDKQMQEIANQIQQLQQAANNMEVADMNPSQEEFMYGTGSQGMKYAYGTGEEGTPPPGFIQGFGVNQDEYEEPLYGSANINNYDTDILKNIQTKIGTTPDGDWGPKSQAAFREWQKINDPESYATNVKKFGKNYSDSAKDKIKVYSNENKARKTKKLMGLTPQGYLFKNNLSPEAKVETNPRIAEANADAAFYTPGQVGTEIGAAERLASAEEDAAFYTPGQVGTPIENLPGNMFSRGINKMANKVGELNEGGFIPGLGDMMKFYGNYKAGTDSMKNALENYAKTPAEVNAYKNFGKESLKEVDLMKENIAGQRDFAQQKLNAQVRAAKKAGASGSRGINVQRALNLAADYQNIQGTNELTANVLQQLMGLQGTKADLLTKRDAMVMKGEEDKNERILKNMDAFYTAKGKAYKDQSMAVQTSGKDLNTMQMNQILLKLLQSQSPNFGITKSGEITTKK